MSSRVAGPGQHGGGVGPTVGLNQQMLGLGGGVVEYTHALSETITGFDWGLVNDLYVCSPYFSSLCQGVSTKTSASRLSSCDEKLRQGFQQVLRVSGMGTDLNRAHDFTTLTPLVAF